MKLPAIEAWDIFGWSGLTMLGAALWMRWGLHWALMLWGFIIFALYVLREWGLTLRRRR